MPGLVVHLQLCERLLRAAPQHGPGPLADPLDPAEWNAFATGSVLPDMGYYPGGDPFLTDLAHYVASARLARALLAGSNTRTTELFALGWATHVLADASFHPLVNAATAELLGRPEPCTYEEAPHDHARVELGWDAWALVRPGEWRPPRLRPVLGGPAGLLLRDAYRSVYGLEVPLADLRGSETAVLRLQRPLLVVEEAFGRAFAGDPPTLGAGLVRYGLLFPVGAVAAAFARPTALYALTHPVQPSESMIRRLDTVERRVVDAFFDHAKDGFSRLPDYNLDTGAIATSASYSLRSRTLETLARRRSDGG